MKNPHTFQLTLVLIVLFLSVTTLLFGWVYLQSLDNKFSSMILSPFSNSDEKIAILEEKNNALQNQLQDIEAKLELLQSDVSQAMQPSISADTSEQKVTIEHPDKKDIYIDAKCFQDTNDLNQCAVFNRTELSANVSLLVKPVSDIQEDVNELAFEFYKNQDKFTTLKTTTTRLFDTDLPIASVVYLNLNDITLQTDVGINNVNSIYNFDGAGWIDYTKFSNN